MATKKIELEIYREAEREWNRLSFDKDRKIFHALYYLLPDLRQVLREMHAMLKGKDGVLFVEAKKTPRYEELLLQLETLYRIIHPLMPPLAGFPKEIEEYAGTVLDARTLLDNCFCPWRWCSWRDPIKQPKDLPLDHLEPEPDPRIPFAEPLTCSGITPYGHKWEDVKAIKMDFTHIDLGNPPKFGDTGLETEMPINSGKTITMKRKKTDKKEI